MTQSDPRQFADVLDFWFGAPASAERGRFRKAWFQKDEAFDRAVRERFAGTYDAAMAGRLEHWSRTPYASLALVVVLDQFPRNMFRNDPRAFAGDPLALAAARHAVACGFDRVLRRMERPFVYLPFEHCEDLAVQRRSLALFASLGSDPQHASTIDYARRHYEIIARFGRFPHRNAVLGRASTAEEIEFLKQPGSGF